MSNYIDSILVNKRIRDHSRYGISALAIVIKIQNDSLTHHGLVFSFEKLALNPNYDSLGLIMGDYQLSYDPDRDILYAKAARKNLEIKDSLMYSFRRVKEEEQRLMEGINEKLAPYKLEANLNAYFIDSLICGHYRSLSENTFEMKLQKTGDSNGFFGYTEYKSVDHFGTRHPFGNEDVIIFTDTTIINDGSGPPTNIGIYSWEINVDTLTFTKMLTEDHENFYKGSERFRFVRELGF
ncbi:hypothetical protein N9B82_02665 [Saprospiraceae bacterium]|nr:hypothetical protein [Saprospiraceae bacterium]